MDHVVFHPRRGVQQVPLTPEEIAEREREAEEHAVQAAQRERQRYLMSVQRHIDEVARSRQYNDGNSCASYVNSTNPVWVAEATAFVAWRDAVWAYAFAELEKVQKGERKQPTVEEFIAELPVIEWPE